MTNNVIYISQNYNLFLQITHFCRHTDAIFKIITCVYFTMIYILRHVKYFLVGESLFADQGRRNCEESHLGTVAGETIVKV